MSKEKKKFVQSKKINQNYSENLVSHPAVEAWNKFRREQIIPKQVVILKERNNNPWIGKSAVYRLEGVGEKGENVIAKRCSPNSAKITRYIYEEVLPHLSLPTLDYYGSIKQINKDVQDNYTIQGPPVTELPKNKSLSSMQGKFNSMLNKLQSEFKLKDSDGVADYHQAWWENWVDNNSPKTLTNKEKMGLVKRWAFMDKSFRLDNKNIESDEVLEWAKKIDKQDQSKMAKDNIRKFEDIFLGVGAEVLSFMSSVLTVNPDSALRNMKSELDKAVKDVQKSGDVKKIQKLRMELERLAAVGGKDKIVPNEGIVFVYKGNTYKLTGAFASLNQILGLMYF